MSALMEMSLLRPFWLLLLPAILVLGFVLRQRGARAGDWSKVIDPDLMSALKDLGRVRDGGGKVLTWLPLFAAAIITLSLAGPAREVRDANAFRNLDGVVFVVDVSASMIDDPLWPELVTIARVGVSSLKSRPAAMVIYAGDSYLASALTTDTSQIGHTLTFLDGDTVPDEGSRPHRGLRHALQILEDSEIVAGEVFLFTDGGGLSPQALSVATDLSDAGAKLSVVFAQTEKNEGAASVQTLANVGGGEVFALDESEAFSKHLSKSIAERLERQDYMIMFQRDFGRYVLFLAALPMLFLFRRRSA